MNDTWKYRPGPDPKLSIDDKIDIWSICLDRDPRSIDMLSKSLSADESDRAARFAFAKDRDHFIVGRGILREVVGSYLGLEPKDIRFSYDRYGKPRLAADHSRIRFNLSHSRGFCVIAVTMDRDVGVDVEFVDRKFDVFSVALSAFSDSEVARLRSLPSGSRPEAFFSAWTRKEACLKAMGDGLSSSPALQSAVIAGCEQGSGSFDTFVDDERRNWSVTSISVRRSFKAALAIEGMPRAIRYLDITHDWVQPSQPDIATQQSGSIAYVLTDQTLCVE